MENLFYLTLSILIILISRLFIIIKFKTKSSSDIYFYLILSDTLRKNKFPKKVDGFYDNEFRSPIIYSLILSLFPKKYWKNIIIIINTFCEIINLLILYYILMYLSNLNIINDSIIKYILIIFSLYPAYISIYPGPRTYRPSPRILGETLSNLYFTLIFLYLITKNQIFIISIILISIITLHSSKFSIQVLSFFTIIISILTQNYFILIMFIISLIISFLNPIFRRQILHQIQHLTYFAQKFQFSFPLILARKKSIFKFYKEKGILGILEKLLFHSDLINLLIKNYLIIILFLLILKHHLKISNGFFEAWLISGLIMFILTCLPFLRFLGEPERYLIYSVIPQFVLLSKAKINNNLFFIFIIFFEIMFYLFILASFFYKSKSIKTKENNSFSDVISYIKKNKIDYILPILNNSVNIWEIRYKTKSFLSVPMFLDKNYRKYFREINQPIFDLEKYNKKYPFKYILLDKRLTEYFKKISKSNKYKIIFENKNFLIYKKLE